jgi:copper(I)-binding protein
MKNPILIAGLILAGLTTAILPAHAEPQRHGDITIEKAWARATPGRARNGGAYVTIRNSGDADRLLSASGDIAERVELHTHLMDSGIMKMRQVEAIDLPANGSVDMKPGGLHIMLMGLKAPLKPDDAFELILHFATAGDIKVEFKVGAVGAMGPDEHGRHGPAGMKKMDGHGQGQAHGAMGSMKDMQKQ